MKLSTRDCMIIKTILDDDGFVTMGSIAAKLSLSKRTILRDLEKVEPVLAEQGWILEKKSGFGVRFCGAPAQREALLAEVTANQSKRQGFSQGERVTYLLTCLLHESEPKKIYTFTQELGVTEATVGSDLNRCERWLRDNGIELVRKPGVGIYIEADEWSRRRGLVGLLYSNMQGVPVEEAFDRPGVSRLCDRRKVQEIRELISSAPDVREVFLSDRSYSAIIIHLYFILQRVQAGYGMTARDLTKLASEDEEETKLANRLLELMQQRFQVQIPEGELGYLVTILRSAQGLKRFDDRHREQQARRIADKLMRVTEAKTGLIIGSNNAFYDALLRHLIPTISRLNMHMEIRNPMLEDIKKHYTQLYDLATLGVKAIEEELGLPVPEGEIGYIAIHLGVALEDRKMHLQRRYRAIICCPSGIVSAKLLSLRVEREFSDIAIVDIISTMSLDYESLWKQGAELVISTVPIRDCPLPCAVVSPFLLDEEKDSLRQLLAVCTRSPRRREPSERSNMASSLEDSKRFIDSMLELLNNFFAWENCQAETTQQLIEKTAEGIGKNDLQQAAIARSLFERENYGSTLTQDGRCMLLHCRTAGVSQLYMGVVQTGGRLTLADGQQPSVTLLMLAPLSCSKQGIDLLSAVSGAVVERPWLVDTLATADRDGCYNAIEQVLWSYYNTIKV